MRRGAQAVGATCRVAIGVQIIGLRAEGACTVLPLRGAFPLPRSQRATRQFAEIGPAAHRLLRFEAKVRTPIAALGVPTAARAFELVQPSRWQQLADGVNEWIQLAQGRNGRILPTACSAPASSSAKLSVGRAECRPRFGRGGSFITDFLT